MILRSTAAQHLLKTVRWYRKLLDEGRLTAPRRRIARAKHEFWGALSGTDILLGARIGDDVSLPHPHGVVIHQDSVIGDRCMIMQQVTIGQLAVDGAPSVGSNVYIGSGARILGNVRIGDGAAIGANAVVLSDVPPGATAVGIPARLIGRRTSAITEG